MLFLIAALFVVSAVCPWLLSVMGRKGFLPLALAPAAGFCYVLAQTGPVTDLRPVAQVVDWVPGIHLQLAFRMDILGWVLALIVLGIGAAVLAYCAWYFTDESIGVPRFAGVLTAFIAAMLGLVLSDDLLLTYIFWELTTVFSFLLVGHDSGKRPARQAAIQALVVTTFGGLAMLVGFIMLGYQAGTMRISEVVGYVGQADPSAALVVAALLALAGAISKSALFPFHFWLPAAMAAPTPVSAYLHAASMVKAGVFLVALLGPGLAGVPGWRGTLVALGLFTMLLGGWRALRQHDLKLLLAFGTVSQLGFMMLVLGIGTRSAMLAGLAVVIGHALFKATLFLTVGVIDRSTGTRDLRRLNGLFYRMPLLAVAATLAAASMAGMPPLLGYVAKESVFVALVDVARSSDGDGSGLSTQVAWLVFAGVVAGSVLTVAYSLRFVWGAFGNRVVEEPLAVRRVPPGFVAGPVLLGFLCLVFGFLGDRLTTLLSHQAARYPAGLHPPELSLWHGLGLPLYATIFVLLSGAFLFFYRRPIATLQARLTTGLSAEKAYGWLVRSLDRFAVETTGFVQRGSATAYLTVILLALVLVPGSVMVANWDSWQVNVVAWSSPWQLVCVVVIGSAAVMAVRSRRRLRAVLLAGATGYGTAVLFVLQGAPDLALTQVLVETLSMVVFVLALRRLPQFFTDRPLTGRRYLRMALAAGVAVAVAGFLLIGTSARIALPVSDLLPPLATEYGGGLNIVNVVLVDTRAWDTLGEISVLVAAATGVAALIFVDARSATIRRVHEIPFPEGISKQPTAPGRRVWMAASRTLPPESRSIIFEVITRLIFHTVMIFSVYLLFVGHNAPGGGFAGGMVAGLALTIRYLAGGRYELDEAAPVDAGHVIGWGLFVAVAAAAAPLMFGGTVLQSAILDIHLPLLGDLHVVTSALFDIGVYLVVIGLVLDLLRALGSQITRQILQEQRAAAAATAAERAEDPA